MNNIVGIWGTASAEMHAAVRAGERQRPVRLASSAMLATVMAFGMGPLVAGLWLSTIVMFEFAAIICARRIDTRFTEPLTLGAAVGLNLVCAAGALSLWLIAPALQLAAALWLCGQICYQLVFYRQSLVMFFTFAAPHAAAFIAVIALGDPAAPLTVRAITLGVALLFLGLLGVDAWRRNKTELVMRELQAERAARANAAEAAADNEETNAGNAVLVIDGEPGARRLAQHTLARVGYRARAAATAAEGLALAATIEPALILLDLRLPDASGWDVLAKLKADPATAAIPVMALSAGLAGPEDRARALGLGACDLFAKPAEPARLAAAILRYARPKTAPAAAPTLSAHNRASQSA